MIRYNLNWPDTADTLDIEMYMIRRGGKFLHDGVECGLGLSDHYEAMRRLLWPHLDGEHNGQRWHKLCRDEVINNKICVLMGPKSSGKTHEAAWIFLCEYLVFPEETCVLVCSTDIRGLRGRVWSEITSLWQQAKDLYPELPGHLLDSRLSILTDKMGEDEYETRARDYRKCIQGVPCVNSSGKFVGISKFAGWKQKRMRLIADEASLMNVSFLSAFSNLDGNEDFKAIILGNPNDILDPLGKAAEPIDGWTAHLDPKETTVWKTRFMGGTCVNLVGTSSPNFDFPADHPTRFKYLISREKIANTLSFFAKDSAEYYSMCVGTMKVGTLDRRVVTREMCNANKAQEQVVWNGDMPRTKIYFVDAAYGGDRCVGGHAEFGEDINGKQVISFGEPKVIPIRIGQALEPEYQISEFVKADCEALGVKPENMGHDATGRGSLGTALARVWSNRTQPVESGGSPTERPVSMDIKIKDIKTGETRLQKCNELYDRRVSEYWFSVRYAIESGQVRNLPEECLEELCARKWDLVRGDKKSVEPKSGTENKPGMKQRTGKSPDFGDFAAGIVEMARRAGFHISKLGKDFTSDDEGANWLEELAMKHENLLRSKELIKS